MNFVSWSFVVVSFLSSYSWMSNTSRVEEVNFPIFDFLKFSALCHILSFLTPRDSPVFSDVRIYFLGAILQSQSLIGRTKFPARAAASLRSKAFSSLAGSDTFVSESYLFFTLCYKHFKKKDLLFQLQPVYLFLPFFIIL